MPEAMIGIQVYTPLQIVFLIYCNEVTVVRLRKLMRGEI